MRLKQYITESRSKSMRMDDAINAIKTHCKQSVKKYKQGIRIYRGIDVYEQFLFVDPLKYERVSANTSNYYTVINDNSPYWKKYPKRSRSIICGSDWDISTVYGTVYHVFPYDNAKIGICSQSDYWDSFPKVRYYNMSDMSAFNEQFRYDIC